MANIQFKILRWARKQNQILKGKKIDSCKEPTGNLAVD